MEAVREAEEEVQSMMIETVKEKEKGVALVAYGMGVL
eukprot:CAMPEP_0174268674 /NCGR_PEP_ID=MMETSP0439-20130205/38274_1 /TAXON_ID=0 /ORGANISM="Stereomyxa ramosa, Strain Chinc5" /LENGTH=36 /DNA_ID= /DNA_START= /DNA_END= /DNA_ORIENTATION=